MTKEKRQLSNENKPKIEQIGSWEIWCKVRRSQKERDYKDRDDDSDSDNWLWNDCTINGTANWKCYGDRMINNNWVAMVMTKRVYYIYFLCIISKN